MDDGVCCLQVSLPHNHRVAANCAWPRIVYTCQKSQPMGCGFFLWSDEAQLRASAAVLNNSRSEPTTTPQPPRTPVKLRQARFSTPQKLLGPQTSPPTSPSYPSLYTPSHTTGISQSFASTLLDDPPIQLSDDEDEDEEFYDWPVSEEEGLSNATDRTVNSMPPPPTTPRKAPKSDPFSTPGKRRYDEMLHGGAHPWPTPSTGRKEDDVFTTPSTSSRGTNLFAHAGLPSPMNTPTASRFRDIPGQEPVVTTEILQALQTHQIALPSDLRDTIKSIGNKHSLFTHGVIKGRDISRSLILKKNEEIAELHGEIAALQTERETNRAVIRHLKRSMEMGKDREDLNE